ncbi:MAG: SurA N-terminal domain-containing protein [Elusimicrobiota bacterium]|jgi:parvulin-like peptidyl-prolyl isomerase|nr:SurA N-terminal domain-containing protein [Elusimicrobiota bacterium]
MKLNKTIVFAVGFLLCANLLSAKVIETTVATVNGKAILSSDYDKLKKAVLEEYQQNAPQLLEKKDNRTALEEEVLNQMIADSLLIQAAKQEGIKVKDSELAEGVNEVKARFAKNSDGKEVSKKEMEKAFNAELKKEGITYKQFEDKIKDQIAVKKMLDSVARANVKAPTKADVEQVYNDILVIMKGDKKAIEKLPKERAEIALPLAAKLNQLTAERVVISPLFLRVDTKNAPEIAKDKEKMARDIKKDIQSGKITFLDAIEKYSDDKAPLANGGELVLIRGMMPKDFDDKVFKLEVGQISEPIKTDFGYYIIRVNSKTGKKDFNLQMISEELERYLTAVNMQKATVQFMESLKDKAEIKVMVKFEYEGQKNRPSDKLAEVKTPAAKPVKAPLPKASSTPVSKSEPAKTTK